MSFTVLQKISDPAVYQRKHDDEILQAGLGGRRCFPSIFSDIVN